jgi:hypothetical protein
VSQSINSQIFEVFFGKIELEIALEILDFVLNFASAKHRNAYRQSFKILIQVHLPYTPNILLPPLLSDLTAYGFIKKHPQLKYFCPQTNQLNSFCYFP